MTTIRNIVVATDFSPGSDAAVSRAVLLAQHVLQHTLRDVLVVP